MFDGTSGADLGSSLFSLPKADLLCSPPVVSNRTSFGILAFTNYGAVLQPVLNFDPAAGAAPVLAMGDLGFDFQSHSNLVGCRIQNAAGAGPAGLSAPLSLGVPPYSVPINPAQPDGNQTLDDGDARLSARVYQVGGVLYAVHGTQVGAHAALQWFKFNASDFSLLQSGTLADPAMDLFYPSIAANQAGTVVVAFK
jgi:hypothetical protein